MVKAIVFDLGGVLIDLDFDRCVRAFREILGYERITELLDLWHQKGIYGDMEAGLITADEFRAEVLRESRPGCVPADVDRAMAGLLTGMDPEKVPLLEELSRQYPVYGLSNNNEISVKRMHDIYEENGLDWRRIFRKEFISCRMKMLKPSREIFDAAAAEIGLPPAEILFVDDSQTNVDGALSAGWQAIYYAQGTDLRACVYGYLESQATSF
jgi:haloacid dehalogenase superfamily, subfamily IA, variant 3 with third motif having DD or ED